MSAPVFPALGASTLARKWNFEVNTGTIGSPTWTIIGAPTNIVFNPDVPNLQDDSDMTSGGAGSQTKTAGSATAQMTFDRKVLLATGNTYDPGQEFIKSKAIGKYGPDNSVQLRIFEYTPGAGPRIDAYMGFFAVGWDNQGGGNTSLDTVQVSFAGQGLCAPITHPYPATPVVPTLTSATPTSVPAAGGTQVEIQGAGFTGTVATTGVKFGATNATSWIVVNDGVIVAVTPAHTAGSAAVVVTNAAGASTSAVSVTYV